MFCARVQGSLSAHLHRTPWHPDPAVAAAAVVTAVRELFVFDDASTDEVTLIGVDTTARTADIAVDSNGEVLDTYALRLTKMVSWMTGDVTVVDDHANAVKHRLRGARISSVAGRIVYDDEARITENLVRETFNTALVDIAEAAELPDTGVIDALNLLVNTGLHRLFSNPGASLDDVADASYEVGEDAESAGSALSAVLSWIDG